MTIGSLLTLFGAGLLMFASPRVLPMLPVHLSTRLRPVTAVVQRVAGALLVVLGIAFATGRLSALSPTSAAAVAADAPCDGGPAGACAAPAGVAAPGDVALPEGKPRLVEFESAHCTVCKRMAPLVKEIEARCAKEAGTVLRIQIDDPAGEALATRYGVRFVPTFLGVDAAGQEVERAVGELPRERLASLLGDVRGEACPPLL